VTLSPRQCQILEFESGCWRYAGPKKTAIREHLGISPSRYYSILASAVCEEEAKEVAPLVVRRALRRATERRRLHYEHPSLKERPLR
jgi:hypothetical protein